jgi:hypothetical protein
MNTGTRRQHVLVGADSWLLRPNRLGLPALLVTTCWVLAR